MLRILAVAVLAVAGLAAGAAHASEAALRKAFEAKFPQASVESITRTPFSGIYEVVFNGQIAYTDEKLNFVFFGNLVDVRGATERNLTRERTAQVATQTLKKSTDQAIKRVRGNGKRVIYTFEDPNCGYCKQLQRELTKITDVTVYTFLWPILSEDSVTKSKAIWCAKDRAKAWEDYMLRGTAAQSDGKCDAPLERNMELAQRFGIRGTPAIFLADGRMLGGYLPADQLEQAIISAIPRVQ
jgi:thiol:disulfide interchange protein DsbC